MLEIVRNFIDRKPDHKIEIKNDETTNQIKFTVDKLFKSMNCTEKKQKQSKEKVMVKTAQFYNTEELIIVNEKKLAEKREKADSRCRQDKLEKKKAREEKKLEREKRRQEKVKEQLLKKQQKIKKISEPIEERIKIRCGLCLSKNSKCKKWKICHQLA